MSPPLSGGDRHYSIHIVKSYKYLGKSFRQGRMHSFHLLREFLLCDDTFTIEQIDQGLRLNDFGHKQFPEGDKFFGSSFAVICLS